MIAFLSQFFLSLALMLCLMGSGLGFYKIRGVFSHGPAVPLLKAMERNAVLIFALVLLAFAGLAYSFAISDFSIRNVAENSNSILPLPFKIAATWGSHEGSFLLWILMFSGWMMALALSRFEVTACFKVRVLATLQLVMIGFLLYLLIASNPFEYLNPAPVEGRDLNPLLQDIVMIIHPPMLYMGYVGFGVSFAFAIAGLLEGRFDMTWARWSRPWANTAWGFLTLGIMLGSWWAYRELGWGGWWFWDPVENASLMPWLAGTALIHSLAVSEKRGALRSWTLLLALTAFALSLLGTFLVRSGVLTSVHAFATDPRRGVFILALLFAVVGGSYVLYALRTREVGSGGEFTATSREALLLSNNVMMSAALVTVMLGTLYPLAVEVLSQRKMSVGQPYFELLFVPILLPALILMAFGPESRWKDTRLAKYAKPGVWALGFAGLALLSSVVLYSHFSWVWAFGLVAAAFLAGGTVHHAVQSIRKIGESQPNSGLWFRINRLSLSYWGMIIAHLGVAVFVIGVGWTKTFEVETDAVLKPGETSQVGPWRVTFLGVDNITGSNYRADAGVFELTKGVGNVIYLLEPEKRQYASSAQAMTESAIHTDWFSDVYVSLGEPVQSDKSGQQASAWGVRLYYKPLVNLIWIGCIIMALGGFLTVFDKRYQSRKKSGATVTGEVNA
ncbi:heme lyase CcmF/NrfE family subunit [Limnobacter litoralis]|uniref:C-type cytochrome biogenesis protein CcmF n=1 Tax=Limnobacter litoralis TaxID=481366 RepID=A0ABQ5YWC5_9BURK|nr:heme lyase CcmF/NrfE family subunit [Limnobacter litoralis]GLR26792.1 c-type cytochrome biogenesis protein CcmF [Limnobacter litoralis]